MKNKQDKKLLLINLGGLGDVLLFQAAVRALRKAFPKAIIWVLTSSRAAELYDDFTFIDNWVVAAAAQMVKRHGQSS